jgi:DNA-binding MarR family transcriptional regulator
LVFRLLQENKEMTITEMSETLRFSHPAVVKIINKMKENGYVESTCDSEDKRRQILRLTKKASHRRKEMEIYWDAGAQVIEELLEDSPNFLGELLEIEKKVYQSDYKERTLAKIQGK